MALPVSVLIPTYNRARYLPETLDAILSQACPPAETIVVDDGSTDDTVSAIASYRKHIRYEVLKNGGVCRARNIAATFATSPYLAFCDSDDIWRSDKLAQQMALHEQDPRLQYSFTNFTSFSDRPWDEQASQPTKFDGAPSRFFDPHTPGTSSILFEQPLYDRLLTFQPIWPSTIVVTADLFHRLGGFEESFGKNPSEDFEFSLRCVQHAPIGVVRDPVVAIRRHPGNFSVENYRNTRGQIEVLEYVLHRHTLTESTRALVQNQIYLRRIEASYDAFLKQEFSQVSALLHRVPGAYLDRKTKLKKLLSSLPAPLARAAHKLLTRG